MDSLSVIITAYNCGSVLKRTLQSAADALAYLRAYASSPVEAEVVIVNDGSTDDTVQVAANYCAQHAGWKVVSREQPTSPSFARNLGVRSSHGELLFFLDGDDLFLPPHLATCRRALENPAVDFVKTKIRVTDPVHPDWRQRMENSLVINLCVRRRCHEFCGGFPDYHLFRREGDQLEPQLDIFYKFEDTFYNDLLGRLFRGIRLDVETVEYCRHPGNSFDRQYEKFCQPYGAFSESRSDEERLRLHLCAALTRYQADRLKPHLRTLNGEESLR